jgi:hypothetical protein
MARTVEDVLAEDTGIVDARAAMDMAPVAARLIPALKKMQTGKEQIVSFLSSVAKN